MIGVTSLIEQYKNVDYEALYYIKAIKQVIKSKDIKSYLAVMKLYNERRDFRILKNFVEANPKKYSIEKLITEYKQAVDKQRRNGIKIHSQLAGIDSRSSSSYNGGLIDFTPENIRDGVYPEQFIKGDYLCGVIDKVIINTINSVRYASLIEYKTGKSFGASYYNMKPPVSHLKESKFTEASLQISFYALLLIKKGFKIKDMVVILKREGMVDINYTPIFYKKECIDLVNHHKKNFKL